MPPGQITNYYDVVEPDPHTHWVCQTHYYKL